MRLQAAADAAEAIFHHVRFAAGVPARSNDTPHVSVPGSSEVDKPVWNPDPEVVIGRYLALEEDVSAVSFRESCVGPTLVVFHKGMLQIDATMQDLSQRLEVIQLQERNLRVAELSSQNHSSRDSTEAAPPPGLSDLLASEVCTFTCQLAIFSSR